MKIQTAKLVPAINFITSFVSPDDLVIFNFTTTHLEIFSASLYFKIPGESEVEISSWSSSVEAKHLKSLASLKAKVADEYVTFTQQTDSLVWESNVRFHVPFKASTVALETPSIASGPCIPSDVWKALSTLLARFSKDNFKGCFIYTATGFVLPGLYCIGHLPVENIPPPTNPSAFSISSVQLNKLLKIGQDIQIGESILSSTGEIDFLIRFNKNVLKDGVSVPVKFLETLLSQYPETLPKIKIKDPKLFKEFLSSTQADGKYDLCALSTEPSRLRLSFYENKKQTNSFVFDDVEINSPQLTIYFQVKHLVAIASAAKEQLTLTFFSSAAPVKVSIDGTSEYYVMQGLVA